MYVLYMYVAHTCINVCFYLMNNTFRGQNIIIKPNYGNLK